ncbi:uncharacterized protein FIBRA_08453 [Fibroporia radiculosa]|uniref:Uncharacterized protein n=1 Tax=Fibroporia radiculosa TaxID=599839 RepID=J4H567_9APHY|nr:uncharacterized protein FIBRA_08453 [Fibroporia radiculosa]CCM06209.1 predicted protein [Fibroporia radiculosa]
MPKDKTVTEHTPAPVVTFHAPENRTFQRVFRDQSLDELKDSVRQKLGLSNTAVVNLVRVQDESVIDLEDDEDFEALRAIARPNNPVNIRVTLELPNEILADLTAHATRESNTVSQESPARKKRTSVFPSSAGQDPVPNAEMQRETTSEAEITTQSVVRQANVSDIPVVTPARKRKRSSIFPSVRGNLRQENSETSEAITSEAATIIPMPSTAFADTQQTTLASSNTSEPPIKKHKKDKGISKTFASTPSSIRTDNDVSEESLSRGRTAIVKSKGAEQLLMAPGPEKAKDTVLTSKKAKKRKRQQSTDTHEPSTPRSESELPLETPTPAADQSRVQKASTSRFSAPAPVIPSIPNEKKGRSDSERQSRNNLAIGPSGLSSTPTGKDASAQSTLSDTPEKPKRKKAKHEVRRASDTSNASYVKDQTLSLISDPDRARQKKKKTKKKAPEPEESAGPSGTQTQDNDGKGGAETAKMGGRPSKVLSKLPEYDSPQPNGDSASLSPVKPSVSKTPKKAREKKEHKLQNESVEGRQTAETSASTSSSNPSTEVAAEPVKVRRKKSSIALVAKPAEEQGQDASEMTREERFAYIKAAADTVLANLIPVDPSVQSEAARKALSEKSPEKKARRLREKPGKSKLSSSWVPENSVGGDEPRGSASPVVEAAAPLSTSAVVAEIAKSKGKKQKASRLSVNSKVVPSHPVGQAGPLSTPSSPQPSVTNMVASAALTTVSQALSSRPETILPKIPSTPRLPAGSEISEVLVESRDEGSSSDGSTSDSEDERATPIGTASFSSTSINGIDVDALLRGPVPKLSVLANLPSESSSDDEDDKDDVDAEDLEGEEERLDKDYRRLSQKFGRAGSSSDEAEQNGVEIVLSTGMDIDPQEPAVEQASFNVGARDVQSTGEEVSEGTSPKVTPEVEEQTPYTPVENETETPASVPQPEPNPSSSSQPLADVDEAERQRQPTAELEISAERSTAREGTENLDAAVEPQTSLAAVPSSLETSDLIEEQTDSTVVPEADLNASFDSNPMIGDELEMHEDDEPIELADDSRSRDSPIDEDDPVETDTTPSPTAQSTPPPLSMPKPGTAKRMKDRNGKVPGGESDLPVLASMLFDARAQSTPMPAGKTSSQPAGSDQVKQTRRSARKTQSITSMIPPPLPETKRRGRPSGTEKPLSALTPPLPPPAATDAKAAAEPKRRGRPPLPAEEKERRAAEKKAERDRVAAEKKMKREAEKAEKAEKARVQAEKGSAKKKGPVAPKSTPSSGASKNIDAGVDAGVDLTIVDTPKTMQTSETPLRPTAWTVLAQESSMVEPELSMVDELRSSSPEHGAFSPAQAPLKVVTPSAEKPSPERKVPSNGNQEQDADLVLEAESRAESEPLFLPGTQIQLVDSRSPAAIRDVSPARSSSSKNDSEEEDIAAPKAAARPRTKGWMMNSAPFPRLSDIASQQLFTPRQELTQTPAASQKTETKVIHRHDEIEDDDDDDESEESGSGSGSDSDAKSHIPRERRAGAGVKKKSLGMLSLYTG